ncbi:hypothetical protein [Burkholderia pyrrocinia]|uniref:hypothetical protein n=1 Tax=Burkholderia pyrrocinia TaxID=60550 RepID=UPI00201B4B44|nr:hypothetical protein [Burkholderia pyrrocinia]
MDATKSTRRDGTGGRPARAKRMPPVVPIASILMLAWAWVATPRYASAAEGVGAKLSSQASAVGGQIRDATLASRVRAALGKMRGDASEGHGALKQCENGVVLAAHVTRRTITFSERTMLAAGALLVERTEGAWNNGAWTDFFTSAERPA